MLFLFFLLSDVAVRKRRKRHGGNNRKQFTEGWVEFKDKKLAKTVARSLNNTPIGMLCYIFSLIFLEIF